MSALAIRHEQNKTVTLSAKLIFYGTQATDELARKIAAEIHAMYHEPNVFIFLSREAYEVRMQIDYEVVSIEEVLPLAYQNTDFRCNFIRLEAQNHVTRSFMGFGLGDNVGHWITSDHLGHSTTAAHEFGHALGLDHPERTDFRGVGNPGIMAPRGTLVDPHLQWNPLVAAGEYGGTLNPLHRRVQAYEIEAIFNGIVFDANGYAEIGYLSNVLFSENGYPLNVVF
ncbi:peptidase M10A and M12B matrixin and adamalysin [Runella slithyformis]|uniref:Peptidase M10A and M12B matrixin and adamalysin n=1 Tax=Runella slithyformis (strain ATCC 29530 / DSM 19594 / LMG 11500 / NCIMB 11436 / LSU 4) TaxID=761193 RepID=A0A7U3ZKZ4_RUNSL|nr:peptidase M10A and M12B matrixin and adamalysin [Runella slithyformis]AEI49101.1 peptidase M10A and M12B matrixin and adamalysin [Runella slithyformis DSM 19594]